MRFKQAVIEYFFQDGVTQAAIRYKTSRQNIYTWTQGACSKIAFYKTIPNMLAGENTNFRVFSRYLQLLERDLLQKAHFAADLFFTQTG